MISGGRVRGEDRKREVKEEMKKWKIGNGGVERREKKGKSKERDRSEMHTDKQKKRKEIRDDKLFQEMCLHVFKKKVLERLLNALHYSRKK